MCGSSPATAANAPSSAAEALAGLEASLGYLTVADVAEWPAGALAGCLRALGRAESAQLATRSRVLSAFNAQGGFEADGHPTVRTWLRWQTQITNGASHSATGWMKRLAVHPRVSAAMGSGQVTASFAQLICDLSDLLPPELRDEADEILLAAAAGGATQADLGMLGQEILERSAPPDTGGEGEDDGFKDRRVSLDIHFRGAGKLNGDLTPECAAALTAMLDALGKKAGPEDDRAASQRRHDALEEACRRLISGGLPDTAGQPTQVQLHMTLDQLRDLPGAADAERAWASARAAGDGTPGWVYSRAAAEAYACDAQLVPVVTGHLDPSVLDAMTDRYLAGFRRPGCQCGGCTCPPGPGGPAGTAGPAGPGDVAGPGAGARPCGPPPLSPRTRRRLQNTLLAYAADILSGPAGLAAFLRTGLLAQDFAATASLPLDTGTSTATVPPHLRRLMGQGRRHRTAQPGPPLWVPSPDRGTSPGLGPRPQRRRHHHRHQPRPAPGLLQPRAAPGAGRLARPVVKWCACGQISRAATPGHVRGVGMVTATEAATCPAHSCTTPSEPLTPRRGAPSRGSPYRPGPRSAMRGRW